MLHLLFLPLPKHQHCKVSHGIIAWGIYIYMPSKQMKNSQMVIGISGAITSLPICEWCILCKHHVSSCPFESNSCSTKLLELVHMDLCGPMQTFTHGGVEYFAIFIDDCS